MNWSTWICEQEGRLGPGYSEGYIGYELGLGLALGPEGKWEIDHVRPCASCLHGAVFCVRQAVPILVQSLNPL